METVKGLVVVRDWVWGRQGTENFLGTENTLCEEFPLWHNGIGGVLGTLGRWFDPQPDTVG